MIQELRPAIQRTHCPMSGSLLLGIDIGTSSSKGVLCTPDGKIVASATVEHETSFPRPGWAEHDATAIWWGEFVTISRRLLSGCLLYTSPSPRDRTRSRMPSSA